MRHTLASFLFLMASGVAAQSTTLIGQVVDAADGSPLVGATAHLGGGGAVANSNGEFRLVLNALPAQVTVRYLGYSPLTITVGSADIGSDGFVRRTFRLQAIEIELGDITVTDENAAIGIMRQVLARKSELAARVGSYRSEAYTRFTLRSRGRYVRFTEELSDAFWRMDGGSREVVLARLRRPDGGAFRYANPQAVPDFYFDDDVVLDGFRFPSPTHPDAIDIYNFRIGGIAEVDGLRLIDIAVTPNGSGTTSLSGRIQVVDSLFVFSEAELRPAGGVQKPSPVQEYQATYRTVFSPLSDEVWLPERFYMQGRVNVGSPGVRLPQVRFEQSTLLSVRQARFVGPDSLWASSETRVDADAVYGGREVFLRYRDDLPMSSEEAIAEQSLGPIPLRGLLAPEGLLRNYVPIPVEVASDEDEDSRGGSLLSQITRAPRFWYNRVDRAHIGLAPTFYVGDRFSFQPEGGFSPDTSLYAVELTLALDVTPRLSVSARGRHGTVPRFESAAYTRMFNTIPTYLGWPDYFDYFQEDRIEGRIRYALAPQWSAGLSVGFGEQSSVIATNNFEGAVTGDGQRTNPPIIDGSLTSFGIDLRIGEAASRIGAVQAPFLGFRAEQGSLKPDDGGETRSYTRLSIRAETAIPTFFRRRPDPHMLRVRALAGYTMGDPIPQRFGIVDGSLGPLAGFGTLRTVELPYEGDRWLGLVWSYDLGRTLFQAVGINSPTGIALHGGHAWTSSSSERDLGFNPRSIRGGHHEIGGSFMRPFGYPIRVDLTRRLEEGGGWFWTIGVGF